MILADWAAIAIDNARLYASSTQRRDHLERAVRRLRDDGGHRPALGGETDLDRILELIVKRARALVEARSAGDHASRTSDELVVAAGAGELQAPRARRSGMPIEGSITGQVLRSPAPRAPRATSRDSLHSSLSELCDASVDSALLVPLVFRGRSVGVLAAFDRLGEGTSSTASTSGCSSAFAASAATAVTTAQVGRGPAAARQRSRPPSRSGGAGRASSTTRRCRALPACGSVLSSARARESRPSCARRRRTRVEQRDRGDREPARADRRAPAGRARRVSARPPRSRASPSAPARARA